MVSRPIGADSCVTSLGMHFHGEMRSLLIVGFGDVLLGCMIDG